MRFEPFALERFQSIWENRVAWNVAESGVHPLTVAELVDTQSRHDALLGQPLGYPQTNGTQELREAVAALYPGARAANVQITNGGSEANCVLLMRLVEPGDEIVFMTPNYMQASGLARGLGATVRPWHLRETSGADGAPCWAVDLDELKALLTPKTRAILHLQPEQSDGRPAERRNSRRACAGSRRASAPGW